MNRGTWTILALLLPVAFGIGAEPSVPKENPPERLEKIRLSEDGSGFVEGQTGKVFRVWGVNYDHDSHGDQGRLLEDYWEAEWEVVKADFAEIKALGANAVRVHLQFGRFMKDARTADGEQLSRLKKLIALADEAGLYLNLTGLGCYHKADTPEWYDALPERERWEAQAAFWREIAGAAKGAGAVFCYDLMNEPVLGVRSKGDEWLTGELGGKFYVQRISLDPAGRSREEIAAAWVRTLTAAIREVDSGTLVTVGVIPWAQVWPGAKPLFYAPEGARHLDFVSIHLYPRTGKRKEDLAVIDGFVMGKPIVIEEIFPLGASPAETLDFLRASKGKISGCFSFYWGKTIAELEKEADPAKQIAAGLTSGWLSLFQAASAEMKSGAN